MSSVEFPSTVVHLKRTFLWKDRSPSPPSQSTLQMFSTLGSLFLRWAGEGNGGALVGEEGSLPYLVKLLVPLLFLLVKQGQIVLWSSLPASSFFSLTFLYEEDLGGGISYTSISCSTYSQVWADQEKENARSFDTSME